MSAESPRKSSRQGGHIVAPQPVSDRSIIESVAGFINEVVPQVISFLLYSYSTCSFHVDNFLTLIVGHEHALLLPVCVAGLLKVTVHINMFMCSSPNFRKKS
jgi:hypothetical protein